MSRFIPPLDRLPVSVILGSSRSSKYAVFTLHVKNDGIYAPRIDLKWEVLPSMADGISVRELSILAVAAMTASNFPHSLQFELTGETVSALVPKPSTVAGMQFSDFYFESRAVHQLLHGQWEVNYVESKNCGETRCSVGFIASFRHDLTKEKVA